MATLKSRRYSGHTWGKMSSNRIVDLRQKPGRVRSSPVGILPREQKRLPLRARRRRVRAGVVFLVLLFIAAVAYAVHWVSYLPALNVSQVTIVGAEKLPPQLVQTFVESKLNDGSYRFFSRSNIFLYPKTAIEDEVVTFFPRIKSAGVSRLSLFSRTVVVTVEERQPHARWCISTGGCFQMDATGFVFASADASTTPSSIFAEPYLFSGAITGEPVGQVFIPGHSPGLLALLSVLQQQNGLTPLRVSVVGGQDFSVNFQEGFLLKASFGADAGTLARNLKLVLGSDALAGKEAQIEYVDLRFGNKAYFKLKGESATSTH